MELDSASDDHTSKQDMEGGERLRAKEITVLRRGSLVCSLPAGSPRSGLWMQVASEGEKGERWETACGREDAGKPCFVLLLFFSGWRKWKRENKKAASRICVFFVRPAQKAEKRLSLVCQPSGPSPTGRPWTCSTPCWRGCQVDRPSPGKASKAPPIDQVLGLRLAGLPPPPLPVR